MGNVIVLTKAQATAVRGKPTAFAALNPIAMTDGTFILPVESLNDPAHAAAVAAGGLKAFPQVAIETLNAVNPSAIVRARAAAFTTNPVPGKSTLQAVMDSLVSDPIVIADVQTILTVKLQRG